MARTIVKDGALKNFDDREAAIQMFKDHISYVKSVVPSNQLLVLYPGDGWGPLCEFLGLDVPAGVSYPHFNRASNVHKRMFAFRILLTSGDIGKVSDTQ